MPAVPSPASRRELIVIGNGMAGMRTVEELLKLERDAYNITVFGSEPYGNYNRIMLSPVLAGEKQFEDIILNSRKWYDANDIALHAGVSIDRIDRVRRVVIDSNGLEFEYDRLLLATGSSPFIIPVPGCDLDGVIAFRDIQDVRVMLEAARTGQRAVVIGGGLLGLEAANGLLKQGMDVTVVHLCESLMERQLDAEAAGLLRDALEARGMKFRMEAQTAALLGEQSVRGVEFADGSTLAADLVVMAAGIRPNTELASECGLQVDRGVLVDDTMQSFDPSIYAVGECVQHRGSVYGLVAPLWEQARVCAAHLAGLGHVRYAGSKVSTSLKVTGIDLYSAGDFIGDEDCDELVYRDISAGVYKRLVVRNDRIVGIVLYGDIVDGAWYFELMNQQIDIAAARDRLVFGRAFAAELTEVAESTSSRAA